MWKILANVDNPFYQKGLKKLFDVIPLWANIIFIIIFLSLSIFLFFWFFKKTKDTMKNYKKEQLEEYRNKYPKNKNISYEQTGMFIPPLVRIKTYWPIFVAIVFAFIGISWAVGSTISTL
ncbi:unknown; predicted coding region [Mycoplasmopsis pulmonis]|uniref:Uncharacterized protein n=1 Tax=Mycoplasmopsis pulmonis (strain UAB CTIP) TaxID=272635 RepID=Q98RJ2_MYCPU|nr:hypothetical protein [Mycoplasmopsis pulmonis]MDZ7293360.1 hypothetical protein [Mycoplasmopsis pulmonis]CAC13189.1 unknown; predicted coding region [Mycoplasmopsis pulmonis]VEU67809.1 Uncharacterised protein [Mycoplasmopsis pulmonis]